MPNINPTRYRLDLTGTNVNNKVEGEQYTLTTRKIRSIAPLYGPFYSESMRVRDSFSTTLLTRGVDFVCLDIIGLPSAQSGKEICAVVAIINPAVNNSVTIDYQSLCGQYEKSYSTAKRLIDTLSADDRPIEWPNIINKPSTFDPVLHLHAIGDVIGFEYLVSSLEQLKQAVLLGDDADHTDILNYVDNSISVLTTLLQQNQTQNIAVALASSANAEITSSAALAAVNTAITNSASAMTAANLALYNAQLLVTNITDSENRARLILGQYQQLFPNT